MKEFIVEEIEYQSKWKTGSAGNEIKDILTKKKLFLVLKRSFDIFFSSIGLICLSPLFIMIAILIKIDSQGPVFYKQDRIGKHGIRFSIYKFRKMRNDVGDNGLKITVANDTRMTEIGKVLRKYKLDELPQLWNVLKGDMSIVGPRPEVPEYVALYNTHQSEILKIRPGITDYASLKYFDEGELLDKQEDPNNYYIETLMPLKIELNLEYIRDMSVITDLKIIMQTFLKIFRKAGGTK